MRLKKASHKATARVGCCGFPVARGTYYRAFRVAELQQMFYEPPKLETARRWREEAPPGFEFTLKAWQLITHEPSSPTYRRLKTELSEAERGQAGAFRGSDVVLRAWERTLEIAQALGADKVVFQCPASFGSTDENKDRMRAFFAGIERRGITCIWEPRGEWSVEDVGALCAELSLVHCVDPFKTQCVTKGLRYYRLHGVTGYRYEYSDDELRRLRRCRAKNAPTYCMFNNVRMWQDAGRFKTMVKQ